MGNTMRGVNARDKNNIDNFDGSLKGSEDDTVMVIQDYQSADMGKPFYRMGERIRVIAQEDYWWRVCSVQTKKENYIPNTHVAKVYHGWLFEGVERQKAEELLLLPGNKIGSFLVRENSRERGVYSLSVRHMIIKHYRISRMDNGWYYISPRLTFQCLEDLINHYSEFADGLCCVLTSPCLSGAPSLSDVPSGAPPVIMRVNRESCNDNMLSHGVRHSIASYLSISGSRQSEQRKKDARKKKTKSVNAFPDSSFVNCDYDDDF
ncbi:src like adaptor 1a isoform X2 [Antennarius striatus]|uniref:src like adaptor 1a isoform X2 n=1 Tax=Antennarius striatus TaxID=241820 RepID=UPI0035B471C1